MSLQIVPLQPDHLPTLSRICHEAFSALHDRHNVPRDVPDLATGEMIIGLLASRADYTGFTALQDGQPVGSNFLLHADEVAGVGPITVDPNIQAKGIGRTLMQAVIGEANRRGIKQIRLFQEAINTTSLPLYTTLGFDWRDSAALMQTTPAAQDDPHCRPATEADLPAIATLSKNHYGFSRANDARELLKAGFPAFLRVVDGRPTAYYLPSMLGHAAANTETDLLTLTAHSARHIPPHLAVFICPLSRPTLYRAALGAKHKHSKVLSYMSYGTFIPPPGPHFPSIQC